MDTDTDTDDDSGDCGDGIVDIDEDCEPSLSDNCGVDCLWADGACEDCETCGDGLFNICTEDECLGIGPCLFNDGIFVNSCDPDPVDCGGECGDGSLDPDEECENDSQCAAGEVCDDIDCVCTSEPICGDGTVTAPEECENSSHCTVAEEVCDLDDCMCIVDPGECGDGSLDPDEECENDSQCAAGKVCDDIDCVCTSEPICGDGTVTAPEECEDHSDCAIGEICDDEDCVCDDVSVDCGDGILDDDEDCDEGDDNSDTEPDACRTDCTDHICGDDVVDSDEGCEPSLSDNCGLDCSWTDGACEDCETCGDGLFNICTEDECLSIGPCLFTDGVFANSCDPDPIECGGDCGNGTVEPPDEECERNADCAAGEICDECECMLGSACEAQDSPYCFCSDQSDCLSGETCRADETCVPSDPLWNNRSPAILPADLIYPAAVIFDNKLWVFDDTTNPVETNSFYSSNGIAWQSGGTIPASNGRRPNVVSFNNKLWFFEGPPASGPQLSFRVFSSTDGMSWTVEGQNPIIKLMADGNPPLAFDGKMWMFGGVDPLTGVTDNNVYSSTGGVIWTQVGQLPEKVFGAQTGVFNCKMWVVGGTIFNQTVGVTQYSTEVYSSIDGILWIKEGDIPSNFHIVRGSIPSLDNKMWVFGADFTGSQTSSVISSTGGAIWVNSTNAIAYNHYQFAAIEFLDKIWLLGGFTVPTIPNDLERKSIRSFPGDCIGVCGNNIREHGEDCEANGDCSTGMICDDLCECISGGCGNDFPDPGEECEDAIECGVGEVCNDNCLCVNGNVCGNDFVDPGEDCEEDLDCDDGEICNNTCDCVVEGVCGNNFVDPGEDCEESSDCGLDKTCTNCNCENIAVCGDGSIDGNEECESDAHCIEEEHCNSSCRCVSDGDQCGNNILEAGEECEHNSHCNSDEICNIDCECVGGSFCGNGHTDAGEDCENDNDCFSGEVCNTLCECVDYGVCGNGFVDSSEECEDNSDCMVGEVCDDHCDCITGGECGNGFVDTNEECEDDIDCTAGEFCNTQCICIDDAVCGNNIVDIGEDCEDDSDCDFDEICSSNCNCITGSYCGNGIVESSVGEECEGDLDCDLDELCNIQCQCIGGSRCGNNILEEPEEECERNSDCFVGEMCNIYCECVDDGQDLPQCGNNIIESPEECEPPGVFLCDEFCMLNGGDDDDDPVVSPGHICGDGKLDANEECDDNNTRNFDGCSSICYLESGECGDGILQRALGEQCEPSLHTAGSSYYCSKACKFVSELCGDGFLNPGEQCDRGIEINSNAPGSMCRIDCSIRRCGDTIQDPGESCDDGNLIPGDGCDERCGKESGAVKGTPTSSKELVPPTPKPSGLPIAAQFPIPTKPSTGILPAQLQTSLLLPLITSRQPSGDTGPAAVAVIAIGAAGGFAMMRKKRKGRK
ncbi:MAG: DUF4215 domain-containing protein [Patescibacteria group bacterium]